MNVNVTKVLRSWSMSGARMALTPTIITREFWLVTHQRQNYCCGNQLWLERSISSWSKD